MILSEKQLEFQEQINSLKKQINLLESHKIIGLITDKQYNESLGMIIEKVEKMEKECGIVPPHLTAHNVLFGDDVEKVNDLIESVKKVYGRTDEDTKENIVSMF